MSDDQKEPAKFAIGDRVRTSAQAPRDYRQRDGTVTEIGPGESEFRVEFEDGRRPTTGYLVSSCLDKVR
jgi:hypothetical protein